jgi:hypothetical protein
VEDVAAEDVVDEEEAGKSFGGICGVELMLILL